VQNTASVNGIRDRVRSVLERIASACARCNRPVRDVTLIAVTKTVPAEGVVEALAAGLRDIGENRVQEAREKFPLIAEPFTGHLIGRLQTNKARFVPGLFDWVHSLDRVELAEVLSKRALLEGKVLNCLLQVNVTGEATKQGVPLSELPKLAEAVAAFPGIRVKGLMTIAALGAPEGELRRTFASLREASEELKARALPGVEMQHLSMGMSGDFEIAIEEGATMVRVGSAIFGPRDAAHGPG